jgi:hypothetical protein
MYKNSVRTSQRTHYVSATNINLSVLFREVHTVYCESDAKHTNALCGQNVEFYYDKARGVRNNHRAQRGANVCDISRSSLTAEACLSSAWVHAYKRNWP